MAERHYDPKQWPVGTRVRVNGFIPDGVIENPNEVLPGKTGTIVAHSTRYLKVTLDVLPGYWYFSGLEVEAL